MLIYGTMCVFKWAVARGVCTVAMVGYYCYSAVFTYHHYLMSSKYVDMSLNLSIGAITRSFLGKTWSEIIGFHGNQDFRIT